MDQIRRLLDALSLRQKISIGVAAVAVLAGLALFLRYQQENDFAVLFTNLSAEDASAVVSRLKERGTEYRLSSDGATIRVPSAMVADRRLDMAAAGIPKTGRVGFELFDKTNFGATEFAEQVNYHRALEGELERTVMTISEVEHARIHITPPKDSVFEDQRRPAKASVLLKLRPGKTLSRHNVKAITHLVSSAVEGLAPEAVSVLDVQGNLLTRPDGKDSPEQEVLNLALLAYRRNVERDLLAKLNATLEPLLGPERFRAAVSVECDLASTEESEETFDPDRSVMTTSQRSEESAAAQQPQGIPGVPSNLPRPTSRPGLNGQAANRRSENISYQTSKLVKKTHLPQGNIRRISASVLLDHNVRWEGAGAAAKRIVEAPSAAQMKAARDIVAAAVGFQEERGDRVVVESLPFEATLAWKPKPAEPAPSSNPFRDPSGRWNLPAIAGAAIGLLALAGLAVYLLSRRRAASVTVAVTAPAVAPADATETAVAAIGGATAEPGREDDTKTDMSLPEAEQNEAPNESVRALANALGLPDDNNLSGRLEAQLAAELAKKLKLPPEQEQELLSALTANVRQPSAATKKAELLSRHMEEVARKNPEAVAQIMQTWIADGEA